MLGQFDYVSVSLFHIQCWCYVDYFQHFRFYLVFSIALPYFHDCSLCILVIRLIRLVCRFSISPFAGNFLALVPGRYSFVRRIIRRTNSASLNFLESVPNWPVQGSIAKLFGEPPKRFEDQLQRRRIKTWAPKCPKLLNFKLRSTETTISPLRVMSPSLS